MRVRVSAAEVQVLQRYKVLCCSGTIDLSYSHSLIYGGFASRHSFVYDRYIKQHYCSWAAKPMLKAVCAGAAIHTPAPTESLSASWYKFPIAKARTQPPTPTPTSRPKPTTTPTPAYNVAMTDRITERIAAMDAKACQGTRHAPKGCLCLSGHYSAFSMGHAASSGEGQGEGRGYPHHHGERVRVSCAKCGSGRYALGFGHRTTCRTCPWGQFSTLAANACIPCSRGRWRLYTGSAETPKSCPKISSSTTNEMERRRSAVTAAGVSAQATAVRVLATHEVVALQTDMNHEQDQPQLQPPTPALSPALNAAQVHQDLAPTQRDEEIQTEVTSTGVSTQYKNLVQLHAEGVINDRDFSAATKDLKRLRSLIKSRQRLSESHLTS